MVDSAIRKIFDKILQFAMGNIQHVMAGAISQKATFPGGQPAFMLPRTSPEAKGMSSKALDSLFKELDNLPDANLHEVMVIKGGKVVAEGSFAPYRSDIWQVSHSLCKTMIGAAVGIAVSEGLFGLEDSVVGFFSEEINIVQQQVYKSITVRHLLTMSSGVSFNEISEAFTNNWVKSFFLSLPTFRAGTKFSYNSMNSYMLAAIIHKTSGEILSDYLDTRLFQPLGFGPITWEKSPEGIEKGGWGMYIMAEDIAKLALLYMQGGALEVGGEVKQIFPADWAKSSTTTQISSADGVDEYGYQIWTDSKENTFCLNGIFGQYAFALPDLDLLIVATSGAKNFFRSSDTYTKLREFFMGETWHHSRFPAPISRFKLKKTLKNLRFARPNKSCCTSIKDMQELVPFVGKTWVFPQNYAGLLPLIFQGMNNNFSDGIRSLRLEITGNCLVMSFLQGDVQKSFPIGINTPVESTILLGGETFFLGSTALFRKEADSVKLFLEICFLECSSVRYIELSVTEQELKAEFSEAPDILDAAETSGSAASNVTLVEVGSLPAALLEFANKNDFVQLRKEEFFRPTLIGKMQ